MGESIYHKKLVKDLLISIKKNYCDDNSLIFIDRGIRNEKPPKIEGYIPDVFVARVNNNKIIIGEAKTCNDLENLHSFNQIKNFLKYCSKYEGSLFILAVPWDVTRRANKIIKICLKEMGIKTDYRVIEKLSY